MIPAAFSHPGHHVQSSHNAVPGPGPSSYASIVANFNSPAVQASQVAPTRLVGQDQSDGHHAEGPIVDDQGDELFYRSFVSEDPDLDGIMQLCEQELSEPYNLYTFRYFLADWPHLTFLVFPSPQATIPIATIVCKQDSHRGKTNRGYIAMLSVDRAWRRRGIASKLVKRAIEEMIRRGAHEIVLETEFDNAPSLSLYESLGFMREKRLYRFYSNGKDAFRLILPLPPRPDDIPPSETLEEAENGRWAVGSGPEGGFESTGLNSITEEDQYFPLQEQTPRSSGRDSPRPPPIPPKPWEGWYT